MSTAAVGLSPVQSALGTVHVGLELFDSEAAIRLRAAGRVEHDRRTGVRSTSAADADDRHVLVNLVARDATGAAVGCGALIPAGEGVVELHRFFIAADARSTSAGSALLAAIDEHARRLEAPAVVYETPPQLTDTILVLQQHGYTQITPWRPPTNRVAVVAYAFELS